MSARLTASGRCGTCGKLQVRFNTDRAGRLVEFPNPCACMLAPAKPKQRRAWVLGVDRARRLACICQDCDAPTVGKPKIALYCEAHRIERRLRAEQRFREKVGPEYQRAAERRYVERNRENLRKKSRAYYRSSKARRAQQNEYKRLWRKLNRDKTRAQKERAALRGFRDPGRYVKQWRVEVAAGLRVPTPERRDDMGRRICPTPTCGASLAGRAKLCRDCKDQLAREAAERLGRKVA